MSTGTEIVERNGYSLFRGATPDEVITAATEVANRFSSIVKDQRLYQRIGTRDHVLIEGWQTVGTLVGVFAVKDAGVSQLPWPEIAPLGERPRDPGREPPRVAPGYVEWKNANDALSRWQRHRALLDARAEGLAFGFTASYRAEKDGHVIGWGEGRCTRHESNWATKEDHALESQAQTRGQSRTLAAPLRFIVKLAGYATTPAEEMDGSAAEPPAQAPPVATLGLDDQQVVVKALEDSWPMYDGVKFVTALERRFPEGIPESVGTALRAWAWFCEQPANRTDASPEAGSGETVEPTEVTP